MRIYLKNHIQIEENIDVFEHIYTADWSKKGNYHYLHFTNEEDERVVLKFNEEELLMTRFSRTKMMMKFIEDSETTATIPTPVGVQHFTVQTKSYLLDLASQKIKLHYQLVALDSQQILGQYQLKISWIE